MNRKLTAGLVAGLCISIGIGIATAQARTVCDASADIGVGFKTPAAALHGSVTGDPLRPNPCGCVTVFNCKYCPEMPCPAV